MGKPSGLRIAFYDSGIGGLPYFEKTRALLPLADYLYLADSASFPIGEKSREEVRRIVLDRVASIIRRHDPAAVVIACNTASLAALDDCREVYPGIVFIGTVPAIKPAAARSKTGRIAVVATARTVNDPCTADLAKRFAAELEVRLVAAPEWVDFVENRWLSSSLADRIALVGPIVAGLVESGVDEIVLACTHFLFLEDAVRSVAGKSAEVIDSSEGVARRVYDLCGGMDGRNHGDSGQPESVFYVSGSSGRESHPELAARFGLRYGGSLT
jgi:glutamate racemase